MNRSVREAKSVKRFEWSNGLDTALYKNIPFFNIGRKSIASFVMKHCNTKEASKYQVHYISACVLEIFHNRGNPNGGSIIGGLCSF